MATALSFILAQFPYMCYTPFMQNKYSDEQITDAVRQSHCVSDVMRLLGFAVATGSSHAHISKRIKRLGLDTSHFVPYSANIGNRRKVSQDHRIPAEEILVHNPSVTRRETSYRLRRAMLEIGIMYECYECHIASWNGKKLNLEIEHRDGNPINNRRENLVFLCPNCHSQTETYCNQCRDKEKKLRKQASIIKVAKSKTRVKSPRKPIPSEERFWKKVIKSADCWTWAATSAGNAGYGRFKYCGKLEEAHRMAWIFSNGDIPEKVRVRHNCGNRLCVNPDHLYLTVVE